MVTWAELAATLAAAGSRAALAGAVAANLYRPLPRATRDIDVLAEYRPGLIEAFRAEGWEVSAAGPEGAPFLLRLVRGPDRADVLIAETEYQDLALSRAADGVLTAEDVIVHKLIAARPHDLDDIRSILSADLTLDETYIEDWARQWDALDRWRRLLVEGPSSA